MSKVNAFIDYRCDEDGNTYWYEAENSGAIHHSFDDYFYWDQQYRDSRLDDDRRDEIFGHIEDGTVSAKEIIELEWGGRDDLVSIKEIDHDDAIAKFDFGGYIQYALYSLVEVNDDGEEVYDG